MDLVILFVSPDIDTWLSGYLLLQFWSYSFNIVYDVYAHNGGVHVHRILMVSAGAHFFSSFIKLFEKS